MFYLKPVEAMTMVIMTPNVATSFVAILTQASVVSRILNGFIIAVHNKAMAARRRPVMDILSPCFANAADAASSERPL